MLTLLADTSVVPRRWVVGLMPAILTLAISLCTADDLLASDAASPAPTTRRGVTRLFIQDADKLTLMWADLEATTPPTLSDLQPVAGFPELDPERQSLVQMVSASGKIMLGVRDDEDGEFQSGWVLVDSGVEEEEHGDHSHWYYTAAPRVLARKLDDKQGNPAHLYCYDGVFYLANDRIGGFTRLDPAAIPADADQATIERLAAFHAGGNGHITLAVSGDLAFSTWMSREEEHARRIDVTSLSAAGTREIAFSFNANSSRLHGATAAAGKVFFAPAAGIDWIEAPTSAKSARQRHRCAASRSGQRRRYAATHRLVPQFPELCVVPVRQKFSVVSRFDRCSATDTECHASRTGRRSKLKS